LFKSFIAKILRKLMINPASVNVRQMNYMPAIKRERKRAGKRQLDSSSVFFY